MSLKKKTTTTTNYREKKNEFHENEKQIDAVGVCVCDYIVLALRLATGHVAKRV